MLPTREQRDWVHKLCNILDTHSGPGAESTVAHRDDGRWHAATLQVAQDRLPAFGALPVAVLNHDRRQARPWSFLRAQAESTNGTSRESSASTTAVADGRYAGVLASRTSARSGRRSATDKHRKSLVFPGFDREGCT